MRALLAVGILLVLFSSAQADGALVIHGGGRLTHEVMQRFVDLGGGANGRLVVIPTAADDPSDTGDLVATWQKLGFGSVVVLHAEAREQADDKSFVAPLTTATAVWFDGGEQSRLERAYSRTLVETELHHLVARGGVVGGSSAGAAIMSRVMIRHGKAEPKIGTGLGLLPAAIIDQHFVARARKARLLIALRRHPGLVGLGIDEGTAIVVHGNEVEVIGESTVTVALAATKTLAAKLVELTAGDVTDLTVLVAEATARLARVRPHVPRRRPVGR